jgi:putative phage-type endonuclease
MDEIIQGTDEWKQLRCGKITGSKIADVMQGKKGTGYANYLAQLVCERLTGGTTETFKNAYMERGNKDEGAARECYEFITGNTVEQVAFIKHPALDFAGVSPDGTIGADGLVEIKRKIPALHINYIFKNEVPTEYRKQMMFQMACTGRQWCDFCSYCPELPEEMQLFVIRLHRDESVIAEMESAVVAFDKTVNEYIAKLKELRP